MLKFGHCVALIFFATLFQCFHAHANEAKPLYIFSAASLKDGLDDVIELASERFPSLKIIPSYGSSAALARQITHGAPANIFISANQRWMDYLEQGNEIIKDNRADIVRNRLVLIGHGPKRSRDDIVDDFTRDQFISRIGSGPLVVGLVDSVPAGIYGKQALQALDVWDDVKGRLAQSDNVRAALTLVALGEAPFGIVYASDAFNNDDVHIVYTFARDLHDQISYPAAILSANPHESAQDFLQLLQSQEARAIFEKHGFNGLETP